MAGTAMDLVLIRNVMIYFDVETKKAILGKLSASSGPMATSPGRGRDDVQSR